MIKPALERKGKHHHIIRHYLELYNGCKTKIITRNEVVKRELNREVKQGNPGLPLLSNLGIEELLQLLEKKTKGVLIGGEKK